MNIRINGIVSGRTMGPRIDVIFENPGGEKFEVQLGTEEARKVALQILEAAEGATQDAFLVSFLISEVKLDPQQMGSILTRFRNMRRDVFHEPVS